MAYYLCLHPESNLLDCSQSPPAEEHPENIQPRGTDNLTRKETSKIKIKTLLSQIRAAVNRQMKTNIKLSTGGYSFNAE